MLQGFHIVSPCRIRVSNYILRKENDFGIIQLIAGHVLNHVLVVITTSLILKYLPKLWNSPLEMGSALTAWSIFIITFFFLTKQNIS